MEFGLGGGNLLLILLELVFLRIHLLLRLLHFLLGTDERELCRLELRLGVAQFIGVPLRLAAYLCELHRVHGHNVSIHPLASRQRMTFATAFATRLSNMSGTIFAAVGFGTSFAMAFAAASFMSSVMRATR